MQKLYLLHAGFEANPDYHEKSFKCPRKLMHLVAKTDTGATRVLIVHDWLPYIYVKNVNDSRDDVLAEHIGLYNIESVQIVRRIMAVGFSNNKHISFAKVRLYRYPFFCSDENFARQRIFEKTIKPHSKFFCETGLRTGAWFSVSHNRNEVCMADLTPLPNDSTPPTLTVMAYDLVSVC